MIYLIEHKEHGDWTIVGLFSSRKLAEAAIKNLRSDYSYILSELPINKLIASGEDLRDGLGEYKHWHFEK